VGRNGRAQHQAFEGFAATQGNVDLAVDKGGPGVDDGPVKCQPLAFMNGNGPGQLEGELYESADLVLGDFSGRRVDPVLDVFPNCRLYRDLPVIAGAFDENRPVADPGDSADLAVEIELFGRRIVLDEHHLGALFEGERRRGRIRILREIPLDFSIKGTGFLRQTLLLQA